MFGLCFRLEYIIQPPSLDLVLSGRKKVHVLVYGDVTNWGTMCRELSEQNPRWNFPNIDVSIGCCTYHKAFRLLNTHD